MSNKTYLVARREFFDMIRTKTFWLGILMFPVIWALVIVVPSLLNKAKSVREYSIIDTSDNQWLSKELRKRSEFPDLVKVFEEVHRRQKAQDGSFEKLPQFLRDSAFTSALEALDDPMAGAQLRKGLLQLQRNYSQIEAMSELISQKIDAKALRTGLSFAKSLPIPGVSKDELLRVDELSDDELVGIAKAMVEAPRKIAEWWRAQPPEVKEPLALDKTALTEFRLVDHGNDETKLTKLVGEGKLFAFFVIPKNPVGVKPAAAKSEFEALKAKKGEAGNGEASTSGKNGQGKPAKSAIDFSQPRFKYVTSQENLADSDLKKWFGRNAASLIRDRRIQTLRIEKGDADWLSANVRWNERRATASGKVEKVEKADEFLQLIAPIVFVYLLWISIFTSANFLLTNTIEEKSNRIIEVLLSSVSPQQLMVGKILGLAASGLVMVGCWALFAYSGLKLAPLFGESFAATVTNLGLEKIVGNPRYMISFVAYYLAGYLLYASVLAGIGSVCNSLKEAQNLMQPVMIFLIVPFLAMFPIAKDPNGPLAKFMTYIPLFTPFTMMNRAGGPPSTTEYVITSVLIIATIWIALKLAGKVFRIGVLMTGKPPKIREIWGWLRQPEGAVPVRKEA